MQKERRHFATAQTAEEVWFEKRQITAAKHRSGRSGEKALIKR
jgi:hypothetical protein